MSFKQAITQDGENMNAELQISCLIAIECGISIYLVK